MTVFLLQINMTVEKMKWTFQQQQSYKLLCKYTVVAVIHLYSIVSLVLFILSTEYTKYKDKSTWRKKNQVHFVPQKKTIQQVSLVTHRKEKNNNKSSFFSIE